MKTAVVLATLFCGVQGFIAPSFKAPMTNTVQVSKAAWIVREKESSRLGEKEGGVLIFL